VRHYAVQMREACKKIIYAARRARRCSMSLICLFAGLLPMPLLVCGSVLVCAVCRLSTFFFRFSVSVAPPLFFFDAA